MGEIGVWPARQAFVPAPARLELFVAVRRIRRGLSVSPLALEEAVFGVVSAVLDGVTKRGAARRDGGRERTRAGHRALVETVRAYFAAHLGQRIALAEVAAAAGVSPFHLARTFRQATGVSLHRYLTRMRLLSALPRASARGGSLYRSGPGPRLLEPQPSHGGVPPRVRSASVRSAEAVLVARTP